MRKLILTANVEDFVVRYYKTTAEDENGEKFYGVYAARYAGDNFIDENESGGIFNDSAAVDEIIQKLAQGETLPFLMCEVLDEICSEIYF